MPGQWDSHESSSADKLGRYFPGSKEAKAWVDGWTHRYSDVPLNVPITDNPFDITKLPAEYIAWESGWVDANANTAGVQRGPATTGAPPVP